MAITAVFPASYQIQVAPVVIPDPDPNPQPRPVSMQKYFNAYLGPTGIAIRRATVTVTKSDGTPAVIYSDNGVTPITSLLTSDDGEFAFYAENGRYNITLKKRGLRDEVVTDVQIFDPVDDPGVREETLAAADGSSLMGFKQTGTGAAARTVQDKLREFVSLSDFGIPGSADNTIAIQAAITAVEANGGGDILVLGNWRFTTLTTNGTVNFIGAGQSRSNLIHTPLTPTSDGIVFTPTGSFRRPVLRNLSLLCSGEGRYGVTTPVDGAQFNSAFAIDFDRVSMRRETGADLGWAAAVRMGDMVAGSFTKSEIRGGFEVQSDPTTQKDTTGVLMVAATANIAVEFNGLQIVRCKTGINLGENVEGFFGSSLEIVNCLDGMVSELVTSKPGGFIDNVHLNVARYGMRFVRRRDFNINNLQLYRGSGHFNGAAEWNGLSFDTCARWAISTINTRAIPGYTSDSRTCNLSSCSDFSVGNGYHGEASGIDYGFRLSACSNFTIGPQTFVGGMTRWYDFVNACSKGVVGAHSSGDSSVPSGVYLIDASSNKRDVKIDRSGSDRIGYDEVSYAVATTRSIGFHEGAPVRAINLSAGTEAYTVDVVMLRANCLAGSLATFRVVVAASANPTIRFCDDANTSIRHSIAGTGSTQRFEVTLVFNNAGWVLNKVVSLVA